MGVSGCGKSTIGKQLSKTLDIPFFDADDFHPQANIEKMINGFPLSDHDRQPWLDLLSNKIKSWHTTEGAILACSALKESYREKLNKGFEQITWIFLVGSFELISERLRNRASHFFKPELLKSQFESLEVPNYGWHISIDNNVPEIVQYIKNRIEMSTAEFGVIGLGVMGKSLALNAAEKGLHISVYNRAEGDELLVVDEFLKNNKTFNTINGFTNIEQFVTSLVQPRKLFLMIPAGAAVDSVINTLIPLLDKGDVIMDGGNSHYKNTKRRFDLLASKSIDFFGVGVSGGEEGARKGPSIMPGGTATGYTKIAPVLEAIAARDFNGNSCCAYIGPEGAGHYVKMVHNGIEYAEMQLLAELFALMSPKMSYESISEVFETWNKGELSSYLLEITSKILLKKEGEAYVIDLILDKAGNKGTGSWSSTSALELGVPNTMMSAAVFARYISSFKSQRIAYAEQLKTKANPHPELNIDHLKSAYQLARLINHHQGFELINEASKHFNWNLNLSEIARIWTNGCIIKSSLMEDMVSVFKEFSNVLEAPEMFEMMCRHENCLASVLHEGITLRIGLPCFHAAFNYWISITTENLPAHIIQAQRDYFGAHSYQRIDAPLHKFFHTKW